MRSMEIVSFSLFLILIHDIEVPDELKLRRLVFDNLENCITVATALDQIRAPIAQKKQCRKTISYKYER